MSKRSPSCFISSLSIIVLSAAMFTGTVVYGAEPHLPLILGTVCAAAVAMYCGYKWETVLEHMLSGIAALVIAVVLAFKGKSLIVVAAASCAAVFLAEQLMRFV